jgi:hypothetical protein
MKKFLFLRGLDQNEDDFEGTILSSNVDTVTEQDVEHQYRLKYYDQMKQIETKNKKSLFDVFIFGYVFSDKMCDIYNKIWSIIVFGFLGTAILLNIISYFL